jgi:hypothetical protein
VATATKKPRATDRLARLDCGAGEARPVDLAARRDRPSDDLDAERWLDDGGSFSSEAVTRWQAQR